MRFGSGNRWDSDGKTIYDQSRVQYDDEAVTLKQTKDITDKEIDMDNLLPQTLKSIIYQIVTAMIIIISTWSITNMLIVKPLLWF